MENIKTTIKNFTDLIVWQEGHKLVVQIYKITGKFPKAETYSLVDQLRRAATSVTSNIAEGFGRQTFKEKVQFYFLAKGSLTEVENQLLIAKDVGYIDKSSHKILEERAVNVHRLLIGLIKKSKTFIAK